MLAIVIRLPSVRRRTVRGEAKVFRCFKQLDDGRFLVVGWVDKYPSYFRAKRKARGKN